jgi:hypothetical protein
MDSVAAALTVAEATNRAEKAHSRRIYQFPDQKRPAGNISHDSSRLYDTFGRP